MQVIHLHFPPDPSGPWRIHLLTWQMQLAIALLDIIEISFFVR